MKSPQQGDAQKLGCFLAPKWSTTHSIDRFISMSDGRTSANSSLLGFPLPVSLAVAVAILGLIGLRAPGLERAGKG